MNVHIRWMIRRDMPEVLAIENASHALPWDEGHFLDNLRRRNCIGMVAEVGEWIVGFMVYDLNKGHISILNLAVNPAVRRRGVGSQMVAKLKGKLAALHRTTVSLWIRESYLEAQHFFHSQGFRASDVFRGYYDDTGEDAYAMDYYLDRSLVEAGREVRS